MRTLAMLAALIACGSPTERSYTLGELDLARYTFGLPVTGDGTLVVSTSLIKPRDWSTATGQVRLSCDSCTLGDDHAPARGIMYGPPGTTVEFGHLTFDSVEARADITDGHIAGHARLRSPDLELDAKVGGTFVRLDVCVRYRPTDALLARDRRLHALLSMLGVERADDGWFYITVDGAASDVRARSLRCEV